MKSLGGGCAAGWLDLQAPVARHPARGRIVVADMRLEIDDAAAVNGRLHMDILGKAPVAFDHRIRGVDAVDHDRHTRTARYHNNGPGVGSQSRFRCSEQNGQHKCSAHDLKSKSSQYNSRMPPPK